MKFTLAVGEKSGYDDYVFVIGAFRVWVKNGRSHRDGDNPSYISNSLIIYERNGEPHRETGPAQIYLKSGLVSYYANGVLLNR